MKGHVVALALALGLTACTTSGGTQSKIDAVVVSLTTAERLALIYTQLPRCPAAGPCSDAATVAKIKDLDNQAYTAVKAAEQNSALLDAAIASVQSFSTAIPKGS